MTASMVEPLVEITYECCGTHYQFTVASKPLILDLLRVHRSGRHLWLGSPALVGTLALEWLDPLHDEQHPECERAEVNSVR